LRKKAFIHTILFLLGFSIIFIALGLTTSFIGSFFIVYQGLLRQLGAVLLVFFGLILTGVLSFNFMLSDKKIQFQKRPAGYLGSILIGLGFADRKSTRLNSSHVSISYAVFCLKKTISF